MMAFWTVATVMAALALAFIVPGLLRGPRAPAPAAAALEAQRKLHSLETAYADGHLPKDEYQRRRQEISGSLLETLNEPAAPQSKAPATAYLLLFLTPLAAVALYLMIGDPRAIEAAATQVPPAAKVTGHGDQAEAPDLGQAITQLAARLAQNPNDVDGWFLLGRSYMSVQRFEDARAAFGRALELAPGEPALQVEMAEAIAFASGEPRLPDEASELLREALRKQEDSQKALWLLGVGAFQQKDFAGALDYWQRLEGLLEPGSAVAEQVAGQIAEARAALGDSPDPPRPEIARQDLQTKPAEPEPSAASTDSTLTVAEPEPSAASADPALTVEVSLSEQLRSRVSPGDTLFVYARAVSGSRMPLAIQRLAADDLPTRVRLDSTMGMMPSMTLATFPQVIVGARISKTGSAAPQPGDLEALSEPVSNRRAEPVRLLIDKVL